MPQPLSIQKRIDTLALGVALVLAVVMAFIGSTSLVGIATFIYAQEADVDDGPLAGAVFAGIFLLSALVLSPLWLWLGFRLRRALNWPKGAFERTERVLE